jgi:MFS family permease
MDDAVTRHENEAVTELPIQNNVTFTKDVKEIKKVTLEASKEPQKIPSAILDKADPKAQEEEKPAGMFTSFRHRNFRYFWAGAFTSNIGNWMQMVGMNWLVLSLTGSPFLLGLVNFLGNAPMLFFGMFGGVIADRHSRKRILYITQSIMLTLVFILGLLTFLGVIQIWMVIILSFGIGVTMAFNSPAYQTIMLDLVGKKDLLNAIALNSMQFNLSRFIGPPIAGFLIVTVGVSATFFFNSFSYLAVILALLLIKLPPHEPKPHRPVFTELKEGFGYLRRDKGLATLVVMAAGFSILIFPYITMLTVFTKDVFKSGADSYGLMLGAVGVGASIGALIIAKLSNTLKKRSKLLMFGQGFAAIILVIFSITSSITGNIWSALILLPIAGCAMVISLATANSIVQGNVPPELRGRIISIYMMASMGLLPLGSLQAGIVAQAFGAPVAVGGGAVVFALLTMTAWLAVPAVRKF